MSLDLLRVNVSFLKLGGVLITLLMCCGTYVTANANTNTSANGNTAAIGNTAANASAKAELENERRLDALLVQLTQDKADEAAIHRQREREFLAKKAAQADKLADMLKQEKQAKLRYEALQQQVMNEAKVLEAFRQQLDERAHHLKDLFSVARQVASDTHQEVSASLTSTQYPHLKQALPPLLESKALPEISDLNALWFVLLQDIQASGEVVSYETDVYQPQGEKLSELVLRLGPFTARTASHYLDYDAKEKRLQALSPVENTQVPSVLSKTVSAPSANDPIHVTVDPTRGQMLEQLARKTSLLDRVEQGGYVGGVIIFLGLIGLVFTVWRLLHLSRINSKIQQQLRAPHSISKANPLGRILAVGDDYRQAKESQDREKSLEKYESLEVKLNEAVLREAPALDRGTGFIKLLATVAPLLGLLGTVTGMIATFQAITLFGTGDPKLMAGGISQALVTTVLGLVVAIPLLFGHSLVVNRVKGVLLILSQESLALVAHSIEGTQTNTSQQEMSDQ